MRVASAGAAAFRGDEFLDAVHQTAAALRESGIARLALAADNGPAWLIADFAARVAGIVLVPLPGFFTIDQREHVLEVAGIDGIATGGAGLAGFSPAGRLPCGLGLHRRDHLEAALPEGTAKITFTSGTSGQPKGVCLSHEALDRVASALAGATAHLPLERHLCTLPLSVLLENIAGAWTALLRGCEVVLPPLVELGWSGSSRLDVTALVHCMESSGAHSLILLPQMLKDLVSASACGAHASRHLRFVAVGGARTAPVLIEEARLHGIPAFEGYGLSECGSVVSLNLPGADQPGSVGRPLPGRSLRALPDGRIEVRNPGFLGYAGEPPMQEEWFDTGDLGTIDATGFVHIDGRSKNVLITAFGRNIAPEWVESELLAEPGILQVLAVGDGEPALGALIAAQEDADLDAAIARCNQRLPDYARFRHWRRIPPLTAASGLMTPNGRIRRREALQRLRGHIDAMFAPANFGRSPALHRRKETA